MTLTATIHAHLTALAEDGRPPMDLEELRCAFRQCAARDVDAAVDELTRQRTIAAAPSGYRISIQKQQQLFV